MNIHLPVQNLLPVQAIETGGLCWVLFFKWEDVDQWPAMDPQSGLLVTNLVLKPDAIFYSCAITRTNREFKERLKYSGAGPYVEMQVGGTFAGNNVNLITGIGAMQFHRYGVLFKDHSGEQRLLGNSDSGCRFEWDYASGNNRNSRLRNLIFTWEHPLTAPVYIGGTIVANGQVTPINPNVPTNPNSSIQMLIPPFTVGEVGAPMQPGDVTLVHADLTGKEVIVFIDSAYVPEKADLLKRYLVKAKNSNYLNIMGGVAYGETVTVFTR